MNHFNILTRRAFLDRSVKIGLGVALSTLVDIPFVLKRALAEGTIGVPGPDGKIKKVLFIFLRGANDGLNSLIPIQDQGYSATTRPSIVIPQDTDAAFLNSGGYGAATGLCDVPVSSSNSANSNYNTFFYNKAIRSGNGFTALHPSLKFMAPVYNAGDLAFIHRVGYPKQSRSHFDSQNYWESGMPNTNTVKDGIFYRTMVESGLASTSPLTGVSVQSALPLILRGPNAAMTNLNDPTRYNLLGIPNTTLGNTKADNALRLATGFPFAEKKNRDLLELQYQNLNDTLSIFAGIDFSSNAFVDNANTDGDSIPYSLFPTSNALNGGYAAHANDSNKYVVDTGAYSFFTNLKSAALVLNKTNAIIAGTELGGFDTHNVQGAATGTHANLMRRLGWAMYGLRRYFLDNGDKATWDNLIVITLSEFGRTSKENNSNGTDHAEAGVMFVAGGGINGGVYGCNPSDNYNGNNVGWVTQQASGVGNPASMFAINNNYLRRAVDYRSVLGRIIRNHLGATPEQLNRIIPGYANNGEKLQGGGNTTGTGTDGTTIAGELPII